MIKINTDYLEIFFENLGRVQKQAEHLDFTRNHLHHPNRLDDPEVLEKYEALTSRFARLQDLLEKPFRTVALLEIVEDKTKRFPDLLNYMEKLQIIPSAEEWLVMRRLRNIIAHEYWEDEQELIELLDSIYEKCGTLLLVVKNLVTYGESIKK